MTKLEEIEALAKKLRCPVKIILKLMLREIESIIINYSDCGGYGTIYTEYVEAFVDGIYEDFDNHWIIETNICEVPLGDYGFDWWLKEDLKELELCQD